MAISIMLGDMERYYLRRYFDGVDQAISLEMQTGVSLVEDNLTFMLGRILDGKSTFQRLLAYPLEKLNADLATCGTGTQLSIEFHTHEHDKQYEGRVSFADLGIVVHVRPSVFGPGITKGLLVQSKKLYHDRDEYRLNSRFIGFDLDQYIELRDVVRPFQFQSAVYFLYNPTVNAFAATDIPFIRAAEAALLNKSPNWGDLTVSVEPDMPPILVADIGRQRNEAVQARPGVRAIDLSSIEKIIQWDDEEVEAKQQTFSLRDCYSYALSNKTGFGPTDAPFLSLSAFIVYNLIGCHSGSTNVGILAVASGMKPDELPSEMIGRVPQGIAARHTLRITISSNLPESNVLFAE